ncbi:MAG TPA: 3-isopropylmalate dehydrogenase, partial [Kofleriaceae bacterium]|nr:3-isopropylmalate dehydrogenase [Kofleriaceae bacterium]
MNAHIVLLSGDGIGPEVTAEARQVLTEVGQIFGHTFSFSEALIGGAAIDACGSPLPADTIAACRDASGVLLGAVGGPKWDGGQVRPEQGLLGLRKGLELYANVRPVRAWPELIAAAPLVPERVAGVDLIIVRELIGGIYFGEPRGRTETANGARAVDTCVYEEGEVRRLVRLGFRLAQDRRGKVTSVDKANVLETSRLWRQVATEVGAEFPAVTLEHQLVDSCAMRLITSAQQFDVIVTENLFGDILSDEASVLAGSLGLLPSAWL